MLHTVQFAPQYRFDDAKMRYIDARGRIVSGEEVTDAVDAYIYKKTATVPDELFDSLRDRSQSIAEVQLQGEREIAKIMLACAMIAKGGRAKMAPADFGRVGGLVRPMLAEWRDLLQKVASGQYPLDGRVRVYVLNLFKGARLVFHRVLDVEMEVRGFDEWKNIRGARDTCEAKGLLPSCRSISAKGWHKRGTSPMPGLRACNTGCGCRWIYRNSITGQIWA